MASAPMQEGKGRLVIVGSRRGSQGSLFACETATSEIYALVVGDGVPIFAWSWGWGWSWGIGLELGLGLGNSDGIGAGLGGRWYGGGAVGGTGVVVWGRGGGGVAAMGSACGSWLVK